jgi:three-Cys-motif partner protein
MSEQLVLFENLPPTEQKYQHLFRLKHPLWTEHKAKMIALYLKLFVYITRHGAYIDGFAGPQQPDMPDLWTARLVLESQPRGRNQRRLNQFFLCELSSKKWRAVQALVAEHHDEKRSVQFFKGDFNKSITRILASGSIREKTATFCLLDQHTFECKWETVVALAKAKKGMKIELFYFVPTGWLKRSIAALKDKSTMTTWWGNDDWDQLQKISGQACANPFLPAVSG